MTPAAIVRTRPRKRFGQHFLEAPWVKRLVDAVAPQPHESFLEIGPGRGALTQALAARVARLVCVEIDRDLAAALAASVPANVRVITADFLETDIRTLIGAEFGGSRFSSEPGDGMPSDPPPVRVVGNIPYNISSPILFALLRAAEDGRRLRDATIMLQKEVAERLIAATGTRAYGTLAIQIARLADVDLLFTLPPGAFRPPPKVSSAVVRLRFRPSPVDVGDPRVFEQIVRGVFLHRRKTLANSMVPVAASLGRSAAGLLDRSGVDPRRRPQELTLDDFARLSRAVL